MQRLNVLSIKVLKNFLKITSKKDFDPSVGYLPNGEPINIIRSLDFNALYAYSMKQVQIEVIYFFTKHFLGSTNWYAFLLSEKRRRKL